MNSLVQKFLNVKLNDLMILNVDKRQQFKNSQGAGSKPGLYNYKKIENKPITVKVFWINKYMI